MAAPSFCSLSLLSATISLLFSISPFQLDPCVQQALSRCPFGSSCDSPKGKKRRKDAQLSSPLPTPFFPTSISRTIHFASRERERSSLLLLALLLLLSWELWNGRDGVCRSLFFSVCEIGRGERKKKTENKHEKNGKSSESLAHGNACFSQELF